MMIKIIKSPHDIIAKSNLGWTPQIRILRRSMTRGWVWKLLNLRKYIVKKSNNIIKYIYVGSPTLWICWVTDGLCDVRGSLIELCEYSIIYIYIVWLNKSNLSWYFEYGWYDDYSVYLSVVGSCFTTKENTKFIFWSVQSSTSNQHTCI